ncbi:squalene/phytoene synthase family protein [Gorillibacterium sp. sgz5001074]|uniref:squalene/phytoene synthase family protein n=1 Tax=Gorillibacterium sp. sgz5001074 TaxID=3446695 RepID=UPI003F67D3D4
MNDMVESKQEAIRMLEETSRTFFIPISRLVPGLQEAVASAYLCMRAIDEIEDHPSLDPMVKTGLLHATAAALTHPDREDRLAAQYEPYRGTLPEVTLRLAEWIRLCPGEVQPRILASVSEMAGRMAGWVEKKWQIRTEEELDDYTYSVAGLVGVMLADLWHWHSRVEPDYPRAIAFGRGLQSVNIIRNRAEDQLRGVDFFPEGWERARMLAYSRRNLNQAEIYTAGLPEGPIREFCRIPLALATATLDVVEAGEEKLSRTAVLNLVQQITGGCSPA